MKGIERIPLQRFADDRGWFMELARRSGMQKPWGQTNLSLSRKGVIRGLHYHERGQDDLFVCLQGTVRVVVLDRESGETFTEDIGEGTMAYDVVEGFWGDAGESIDVYYLGNDFVRAHGANKP